MSLGWYQTPDWQCEFSAWKTAHAVVSFDFTFTVTRLQIWSTETIERLTYVPVKPTHTVDPLIGSFLQGVCTVSVAQTPDHVCIGSSTGSMHVFTCSHVFQLQQVWHLDVEYWVYNSLLWVAAQLAEQVAGGDD